MLKLILIVLFILIFFIFSLVIIPVLGLVGLFNQNAKDIASLRIIQWVFKVIVFITGSEVTVLGLENVPDDKPVLYVGNHRSYFDIVISLIHVKRPTGYVSKKENGKIPILSWWMSNLHCLLLDRDDLKQGLQTILTAIELVKKGYSICIFPEGTRNKVNDTFLPFREGSFKIVQKSGCLIQPFVFVNAADIYEDHSPKIKKAKVILEYLPPVDMSLLDREEAKHIGATVQKMIEDAYFKNKEKYKL